MITRFRHVEDWFTSYATHWWFDDDEYGNFNCLLTISNCNDEDDGEYDHVGYPWWLRHLLNPWDVVTSDENNKNWYGRNTKQGMKQILLISQLLLQARFLINSSLTSGERGGGDCCSVFAGHIFGSWAKIFQWGVSGSLDSDLLIHGVCGVHQWWEKGSSVYGTTSKGAL